MSPLAASVGCKFGEKWISHYQHLFSRILGVTFIYKNIHDSHIYINHLNDKITELTVTVLSSKVISDNIQLFHPILKSIQKLNINLDSGSVQNIPELLNVINFCRRYRLKQIKIKCSFHKLSIENHQMLWKAMYEDMEKGLNIEFIPKNTNYQTCQMVFQTNV